ncbi:hypothetical protein [Streptomyces lutosisoli]|uniref:PPM-type phosphatase domain-containing protein n=1 Tax=Streptomyces lutosisoli TaxID=2665721 RepID=A0ABW2VTZ9_9ACTN
MSLATGQQDGIALGTDGFVRSVPGPPVKVAREIIAHGNTGVHSSSLRPATASSPHCSMAGEEMLTDVGLVLLTRRENQEVTS